MQIFFRIREWREENKKLGVEPTISDNWTPEQRKRFLQDWLDDSVIIEASRSEKRSYDEMMNEDPSTSERVNEGASTSQAGRGKKRSHDEVDDEDDERPCAIEGHSTQLKDPISFPFKPAQALTTKRILSEVQRVVQSN